MIAQLKQQVTAEQLFILVNCGAPVFLKISLQTEAESEQSVAMRVSDQIKYRVVPLLIVAVVVAWGVFSIFKAPEPEPVQEEVASSSAPIISEPSAVIAPLAGAEQDLSPAHIEGENWFVRCDPAPENAAGSAEGLDQTVPVAYPAHCEVYSRLNHADSGMRIVELAVGTPIGEERFARGALILPLGIYLPDGVTLQIDEGQAFRADIRSCTKGGCVAQVAFNQALLDMLARGQILSIHMKTPEGQKMQVKMPLTGFAPRWAEISR